MQRYRFVAVMRDREATRKKSVDSASEGPGPGFNKRTDATRLLDVDSGGAVRSHSLVRCIDTLCLLVDWFD